MSLGRAIGATSIASACSAVAAFLVSVLLARLVGPAGQGLVNLVTTSAALVTLLGVGGTGLALRLRSKGAPDPVDFHAFAGYTASLAPLVAALGLTLSLLLHHDGWSSVQAAVILVYGASAFTARQAQEGIQALGNVPRAIWGVVVAHGTNAALLLVAMLLAQESLTAALLCATAGQMAQTVVGVALTPSATRRYWTPAWDGRRTLALLRTGVPSMGYSLGLFGMQRIDRLLLVALASPTAAGYYAVAASLAEAGRLLTAPIGQQLFVRVSGEGFDQVVRRARTLVLVGQALPLAALGVFAPLLVPQLFGEQYGPAILLIQILVVAEFFMGSASLDSRILLGLARTQTVSLATLAAVAVALMGYVALIPSRHALGAAVATTCTYAIYAGCLRLLADRAGHSTQIRKHR